MAADPRPGPFAFSHTVRDRLGRRRFSGGASEPTPVKAPQLLAFK